MQMTQASPRERLPRTGRRRFLVFVLGVLAMAAAVLVAVNLAGAGAPTPRAPGKLVVSPFGLGGNEGAVVAGMSEQLAADAATTGEMIGPDYDEAALTSQAPGRAAVMLRRSGEYVQFTLRARANAIDVSYALRPGATAALTVQVDGTTLAGRLALRSPARYVRIPVTAGELVPQYFSDARLLLGHQLKPGDTVRLTETAVTSGVPCTIAVADFYQVQAPAAQPRRSVSVVAEGADPKGRRDSSRAFQRAIQLAEAKGAAVWIPPGRFWLSSALHASRATIIGAGSWYSLIRGSQFLDNPQPVSGPVNLSGFAIQGPGTTTAGRAAVSGSLGTGSVVSGLWVQGTDGGLALSSGNDYVTVQNSQILSTQSSGVAAGPAVFGAWVRNNLIRNSGSDGVALWSDSHTTVSNNTVVEPVAGSGIAEYGGSDNMIISNVVADTHAAGSGIQVANPPPGSATTLTSLAGVITVADNAVLRCGSPSLQAGVPFGALAVDSGSSPVSNAAVNFASDRIDDSPYSAIEIGTTSTPQAGKPVSGVTFDGDSISGTGAVAVEALTGGSATFSNVTGKGIGVPGSFEQSQLPGRPGFSFLLGTGNTGWSLTPALARYPGRVLPGGLSPSAPSPASKPSPAHGTSPVPPARPSPAAPSPTYQAPAPSPTAQQAPVPPSPVARSSPPAGQPPATTQPGTSTSAPTSPAAPSLSESASAVAPGTNLVITYSTPAVHQNAWIGIYVPGQPAGSVLPACARVASGASGMVACNTGSLDGPGPYDIYYGYGYGPDYHQLAGPLQLTVTGARSTLSESATIVEQGANVQMSYSTPSPTFNNWVGIYSYGQPADFGQWKSYQWAVDSAGSVTFNTGNLSPGRYYVYLNYDDSYSVLTGPLTLTISSRTVVPGAWSGYVVKNKDSSQVTATFTVPAVSCQSGENGPGSTFWVGIQSTDSNGKPTLVMAGINVACTSGQPSYGGWMVPDAYDPAVDSLPNPVQPEDQVTATVENQAHTGQYLMMVSDHTQNWSQSKVITGGNDSSDYAAVAASSFNGGAFFNPMTVTGATVNGAPLAQSNPEADQEHASLYQGTAGLDPGPLDASGENFSFFWTAPPSGAG